MANDMNTQDDQALADEWAAALEETGDAGQDDIDALLAADAASSPSIVCRWKSSAACRKTTSRSPSTVLTWT